MNIQPTGLTIPGIPPGNSATRPPSGNSAGRPVESSKESFGGNLAGDDARLQLSPEDQSIIKELSKIDREVRAHEQAHAAAGGAHAGAPSLTLERGPNGRLYATGGEVSIDSSPVPGDPKATLEKALVVQRAARAPANPSQTDQRIAAEAAAMAAQARAELTSADQPAKNQGTTSESDNLKQRFADGGATANQTSPGIILDFRV